jgi:hypothetical protein
LLLLLLLLLCLIVRVRGAYSVIATMDSVVWDAERGEFIDPHAKVVFAARPKWIPDEEATECKTCLSAFSMFLRRVCGMCAIQCNVIHSGTWHMALVVAEYWQRIVSGELMILAANNSLLFSLSLTLSLSLSLAMTVSFALWYLYL